MPFIVNWINNLIVWVSHKHLKLHAALKFKQLGIWVVADSKTQMSSVIRIKPLAILVIYERERLKLVTIIGGWTCWYFLYALIYKNGLHKIKEHFKVVSKRIILLDFNKRQVSHWSLVSFITYMYAHCTYIFLGLLLFILYVVHPSSYIRLF